MDKPRFGNCQGQHSTAPGRRGQTGRTIGSKQDPTCRISLETAEKKVALVTETAWSVRVQSAFVSGCSAMAMD